MCRKCKKETKVDCVFQISNPNDESTYKVCRFALSDYKCSLDESEKVCYESQKDCCKPKRCKISTSYKNQDGIPFYLIDKSKYERCKFSVIIPYSGNYYCCHFKPSKETIKLLKMYKFIAKDNDFVKLEKGKDDEEIGKVKAKFCFAGYKII